MRFALALALLLLRAAPASAEWQIRPFVGAKFGAQTTFYYTDRAIEKKKLVLGVAGALVGEVLGIEMDFARLGGFFQSGLGGNVLRSSVTTLTGNVTMSLPRRLTEYTLRPYFVAGGGIMWLRNDQVANPFDFARDMPAMDLGGGVTGFLTRRIGLNWDVRHFRTVGEHPSAGVSDGPEQLSFWRANMALAIRY
jgi:hypothetical protein